MDESKGNDKVIVDDRKDSYSEEVQTAAGISASDPNKNFLEVCYNHSS